MAETRGERKERTRRAILDAALRLCEDSSLVALSLRQVAKEVGIVPTAFYRHFDSIEALGLALVDESFVSLRAMLRDIRRGDPSYADIVDRSITVRVEHVHQQRANFLFIARERAAGPGCAARPTSSRFRWATRWRCSAPTSGSRRRPPGCSTSRPTRSSS